MTGPFPTRDIVVLGLVTIAAYGAWYYSFGVLLDPILDDTGWSESWLSGGFSIAFAAGGVMAIPAGRLLDRVGSRPVFLIAACVSTASFVTAASARSLLVFTVASAIGGATLGGLGFYHITQTTAVRAAPRDPARAIALLTVIGAFSSTIYVPLSAFLVTQTNWRWTIRVLAGITGAVLVLGASSVVERERPVLSRERFRVSDDLARPEVRRFVIAAAIVGLAVGVILVYQVPLMTAAGLPITTAAWVAGARGLAQITGRVPLPWIIHRLGARGALRVAFGAITVGVATLAFAGNVLLAGLYALVAGFGIGATSPLQGIYTDELVERASLGASMGAMTTVFAITAATGPAIVGILADATGSRWWGVIIAVCAGVAATALLRPGPTPSRRPTRRPPAGRHPS